MAERLGRPDLIAGMLLCALSVPVGLLAGYRPTLAIAAALGFVFVLVALNDLALGLAMYVLASFVGLPAFGFEDGVARLVLGLAWFALIATRRKRELEFPFMYPGITVLLGLLVAWSGLSVAWSEDGGAALTVTEQFAANAVLVMIVFTAIRTTKDLSRVLVALVLGASLAVISGLAAPIGGEEAGRLGTKLLDPNILAAALVPATAICVAVYAINLNPEMRLLMMGCALLCGVAILLTASRGALFAIALCLLAAVVLGGKARVPILVGAVTVLIGAAGYFTFLAPAEIRERVTEPIEGQERVQEGRTTLWQVAQRAAEDEPVTGVGAGNFRVASRHYIDEPGALTRTDQVIDRPVVVHNAYLEVAAELGAVGLALFAGVLAACLWSMYRAARLFRRRGVASMQAATIAITIALIGVLAANFFLSDHYSKPLWLLLALGPALLTMARAGEPGSSQAA